MLGSLKSLSRANVHNKTSLAGSSKAYKNAAAQKASSYRTYAQRKALMSMDSNRSVRLYSTPSVHPTDATTTAPVPILESLTKTYDPAKITQNTMLVKLDDLVALPDTFAVVHIGGHQVRIRILTFDTIPSAEYQSPSELRRPGKGDFCFISFNFTFRLSLLLLSGIPCCLIFFVGHLTDFYVHLWLEYAVQGDKR